jgi:hypothetical protein
MAEEKHEHKAHEERKPEHKSEIKKDSNTWRYTTVALMVVVVLLLAAFLWKPGETSSTSGISVASQNQIANKTVNFLNENIISGTDKATLSTVSLTNGIVNVTVLYQGRQIPVYATEDGQYLILPGGGLIDMSVPIPKADDTQTQQSYNPEKNSKPTVQLFVMAFCPYGMQAENAMKPVFDLLGSKIDLQVRFIAGVTGTTPDTVTSLHGAPEAQEDLRQVCVMKYYDDTTLWKYIMAINANCSSSYRDNATYDPCWRNAAKNAGIDAAKIDTCAKGSEGVALLKADADLSNAEGVSGSPTLIINGARFNGARTPDGYKQGICQAFTTAPSECSQNLSTSGETASGNC